MDRTVIDDNEQKRDLEALAMKLLTHTDEPHGNNNITPDTVDLLRQVASALVIASETIDAAQAPDIAHGLDFYDEVKRFEISLIQQALKYTGGNQARAARLLGLKQPTLYGKIKQYGINQRVLVFNNEAIG